MKYFTLVVSIIIFHYSFSQRTCGTMDNLQQKIDEAPELFEVILERNLAKKEAIKRVPIDKSGIYKIPVVVHLIGNNIISKFSANNYQKVKEQIHILNEDYGKIIGSNGDGDGVDTGIEFCLARIDPFAQNTVGVTAIGGNYPEFNAFLTNNEHNSDFGLKHLVHWPEDQYLNIYVADLAPTPNGGVLLGYGTFPAQLFTHPDLDGVVVDPDFFGNSNSQRNGAGRTLTHEVGHWLDLRHTWGDGGCAVDDEVEDTPICSGDAYADYNNSCSIGQNINQCITENSREGLASRRQVENYMDYSDDLCMNMFTEGQADRMVATLLTERPFLWTTLNTQCFSGHCANGLKDADEVGIDCGGTNCPPCEPSGGIGKKGLYTIEMGMAINGFDSGIPCIEGNIILSPNNTRNSQNPRWKLGDDKKSVNCSDADKSKCDRSTWKPWKCDCWYLSYFIEIVEVNTDLKEIGSLHSKWFSHQVDDAFLHYYENIQLNQNDLLFMGVLLEHGKNYRIKLAHSAYGNGWQEAVRFFKYLPKNISKSGDIQSNLSANNNIIISNATINQPREVVAGNLIRLLPETRITAGHYYIDENLCNNDKSTLRMLNKIGNDNEINIPKYEEMNIPEYHDNEPAMSHLEAKDFISDNIRIYPNPNNGQFNIELNNNEESALIDVYDVTGKKVFSQNNVSGNTNIDIKEQPRGMYFIRVTIAGQVFNEKIIYQ